MQGWTAIGDQSSGDRPSPIGCPQDQGPKALGLAIFERSDVGGFPGLQALDFRRITDHKLCLLLKQAPLGLVWIDLSDKPSDALVTGITVNYTSI